MVGVEDDRRGLGLLFHEPEEVGVHPLREPGVEGCDFFRREADVEGGGREERAGGDLRGGEEAAAVRPGLDGGDVLEARELRVGGEVVRAGGVEEVVLFGGDGGAVGEGDAVRLAAGVVGLHEPDAAVVVVLVGRQAEDEDGVCALCAVHVAWQNEETKDKKRKE